MIAKASIINARSHQYLYSPSRSNTHICDISEYISSIMKSKPFYDNSPTHSQYLGPPRDFCKKEPCLMSAINIISAISIANIIMIINICNPIGILQGCCSRCREALLNICHPHTQLHLDVCRWWASTFHSFSSRLIICKSVLKCTYTDIPFPGRMMMMKW